MSDHCSHTITCCHVGLSNRAFLVG